MSHALFHARRAACMAWPKAAKAILSLTPVARPGLGTLAVDKHWRIYYDEAWMATQPPGTLTSIILHEVSHLMLRHFSRGETLPSERWNNWNLATDAAINGGLRQEGHTLPDGAIFAESLGMPDLQSTEFYFKSLIERESQQSQEQSETQEQSNDQPDDCSSDSDEQSDDQGTEGDDSEAGDSGGDPDATEGQPGESGDTGDQRPAGMEQPVAAPGQSGSCSDGQQRPWELGEPSDEAPGMDEYDAEQTIKQFAEAVMSGKGNEAGGQWREWAKQVLKPKRDVMAPIRRLIRQTCELATGIGERSYRRPSRRTNADLVLPSNVCPIPRICVIVDTSGSMNQLDISLALGAVKSVLDGFRIRDGITFITGDTRVQLVQTKLGNVNRCQFKGGGGTSMIAPIKHAVAMKPQPQLLIVCTDGEMYASDWGDDPRIPTLAVITRRESSWRTLPDWLHVAIIG